MGLETLIVILVILIVGILADGVRRMLKERNSRLHLRIDPKAKELVKQPYDERNPELPSGGARTVRSGEPAARRQPDIGNIGKVAESPQEQQSPPLVMEPEEEPAQSVTEAVQVDLFGAEDESDQQPLPEEPTENHTAAAHQPPSRPANPELLEVIVMHMVTPASHVMPGRDLLQALLEQGLRYGEMNIFHLHQARTGADELQFSMANALEPGTFDIDSMETQGFRAVTFFLKMPGPSKPAEALERMIKTVRHLGDRFGGEVRDDKHSVLTQQTVEHMREKVREFERRSRVAGV
ncbi:MAG: cell division protein ZipA [Alcanivoracaceae bacterium]|nr:cell division protein ZipA [Alcanivoracaceae bacterium]